MNLARSTVSRARLSTICSVSSVISLALYIFSSWRSSSSSYSNISLDILSVKSAAFKAKGRSTLKNHFRSSSPERAANSLASKSMGVVFSCAFS